MTPRTSKPAEGLFWITGASSGIGREVALQAVRRGWRVVATARRPGELETLAAEAAPGTILSAAADITDEVAMTALIAGIEATHGPIARAFLNAGLYLPVRTAPFEASKFHQSFAVNLGGTVNSLAAILPRMIARGGGQIAINASVAGYTGLPMSAAYGATKAGLINLAESLKFDCDNQGVLLQIVSPGFVKTPATAVNRFPMPFLQEVSVAATRILDGMEGSGFEITFPRRFAILLKLMRMLPYPLYFALMSRQTGWHDKKD